MLNILSIVIGALFGILQFIILNQIITALLQSRGKLNVIILTAVKFLIYGAIAIFMLLIRESMVPYIGIGLSAGIIGSSLINRYYSSFTKKRTGERRSG